MGRYGTPVLLSENEILDGSILLTARMSWIGHLIAAIVLLGWVAAVIITLMINGFSVGFSSVFQILISAVAFLITGGIGLTCLLAGGLFLSSSLAAMRGSNWTLRATEEGLYLKLRSYVDYRLSDDDKIVVFIPRAEIRQIRSTLKKARVVSRQGNSQLIADDQVEKQDFMEIELYGHDLSKIRTCLEEEKRRNSPTFLKGVASQAKGAAIRVQSDGILKLDWKTKNTRMKPNMAETLVALSDYYATAALEEREQVSIKSLDKDGQESRLIELASTGSKMDAVVLARELYALDLSQAKQFVDELLECPVC